MTSKDKEIKDDKAQEEVEMKPLAAAKINYEPNEYESHFTLRSFLIGVLLGVIPTASNLYLGYKTGTTFGATFFAIVFGFPIMNFIARTSGGQPFNVKEHCSLSSVSNAISGLTAAGFGNGFPAMFRLGVMDPSNADAYMGKILAWSTGLAFFGCFFAIPLRKWFVIRQKDLPFPSPTGAAHLLMSLHTDRAASDIAGRQFRALLITATIAFVYLVVAFFVPVLAEWHIFWWFSGSANVDVPITGAAGFFYNLDRYHVFISLSFAMFGSGMMMGPVISSWYMAGSLIGWPLVGLIMEAQGTVNSGYSADDKAYAGTHTSLNPKYHSTAFWLLWPGITILIVSAFTELGLSLPGLIRGLVNGARGKNLKGEDLGEDHDPVPASQQVPVAWWGIGGILTSIYAIVIMYVTYNVPVGESILAIILGFIFAFVALQAAATTDSNPVGTTAKITQGVFSPIAKGDLITRQTVSLVAAMATAGSAAHTVDLIGDLKTGHLVGASPRSQFLSQALGSLFAAPISTLFFWVYIKAYPCIISHNGDGDKECTKIGFGLSAPKAWHAFTTAVTNKDVFGQIPHSSQVTCLVLAISVFLLVIVKEKFVDRRFHRFFPSWQAIGTGLILPNVEYSIISFIGAMAGLVWKRRSPLSYEVLMFAVASGFITGDGMNGLVQAILTIILGKHKDSVVSGAGMPA
ncbi:hypothetical protein RI367_006176 [Sorochytrium milnesiophthora]